MLSSELCVRVEGSLWSYVTLSWLYDRWLNPTLLPPVTTVYLPPSADCVDERVCVCEREGERQRDPCLLVATFWLTGLGWLPAALGQVPRACWEYVWTVDRQEPAIGLGGEVTWPRISPGERTALLCPGVLTENVCVCHEFPLLSFIPSPNSHILSGFSHN